MTGNELASALQEENAGGKDLIISRGEVVRFGLPSNFLRQFRGVSYMYVRTIVSSPTRLAPTARSRCVARTCAGASRTWRSRRLLGSTTSCSPSSSSCTLALLSFSCVLVRGEERPH